MEEELTLVLEKNNGKYLPIEKEDSLFKIHNLYCNNVSVEPDFTDSVELCYYGFYYKEVEKNYDLMKKYFLAGIELGCFHSMFNLASYYEKVEKNYDLMKKYYLMTIELNSANSMYGLAKYYETVGKNYDLTKKYYLMAVELGHVYSMNNLGFYYENVEKNYDLMKKYYLMAIELGNVISMLNLGSYYEIVEKNYDLMKKYYFMGLETEDLKFYSRLKRYYENNEEDFSFLKYADKFGPLIQKRFKQNVDLPREFYTEFCQLKNVSSKIRMKQYILKKTTLFPKNYSKEYDIGFMELISMASTPNKYALTKDILLLIAGHLHT